jgi:hypothetical protein
MMHDVACEPVTVGDPRGGWLGHTAATPIRFAIGLMLLTSAGCGIPAEREPREIVPEARPSASSATGAPIGVESGPAVEALYFVRDGKLVAVRRAGPRSPSAETQLEHLLAGPTEAEHEGGLSSALPGLGITARLRIDGTAAVVDLGIRPESVGRSDEVLAYGQIVCTLTARPDIDTVIFHYEEQPVDVPRADGSLGRRPLAAADYASLIVVP